MEVSEDSLLSAPGSSGGWGFDEGSSGNHAHRHKTGSVSFQNALHDLQKEREGFAEEDQESDDALSTHHEARTDSGIQDLSDPHAESELAPTGTRTATNLETTGSAPHPPNSTSQKHSHHKSMTRRTNSFNAASSNVAASHVKPRLNLSFRDTGRDSGLTGKSQLPKLRRTSKTRESFPSQLQGQVVASPASSPKLLRRKSLEVGSPSPSHRRLSAYDSPLGFSDNYSHRPQRVGAATHASVPSLSSGRSDQSNLRRYSSINLPPIAGATHRRHSSVVPAQGSPTDPARHVGPLSSNILAHTFGSQGGGGVLGVARQRRVSQAVDELLHIEELRQAREMRNLEASAQSGRAARGSQSRDLGHMLQGLKDCRYLRGSANEEEFV